ncbi:MAG: small-conductance mechanosensitive channel [Chitinophagales bacterium]|jgi:small-conductance mechanosensitive channel
MLILIIGWIIINIIAAFTKKVLTFRKFDSTLQAFILSLILWLMRDALVISVDDSYLSPHKVGDLIESQGHIRVVKEIQLFTTILLGPENKTVILPHGAVSNDYIVNYAVEGLIRVDCSVDISYGADIAMAKEVLMAVLQSDKNVLKDPSPFAGVTELADSSVNLAARGYNTSDKYWDVFFRTNEE